MPGLAPRFVTAGIVLGLLYVEFAPRRTICYTLDVVMIRLLAERLGERQDRAFRECGRPLPVAEALREAAQGLDLARYGIRVTVDHPETGHVWVQRSKALYCFDALGEACFPGTAPTGWTSRRRAWWLPEL